MDKPRILVADDEENIRFVLERTLQQENYLVDTAENGVTALQKAKKHPYDLYLLDLQMGAISGLDVLQSLRQTDEQAVVIILTAHSTVDSAIQALRLGAFDYLLKPAVLQEIRQRVSEGLQQRRQALHHQQLIKQISSLRQTLDAIDTQPPQPAPPSYNPQRFIRLNSLIIDQHHRLATLNGHRLDLTTAEFDILVCLALASPKPLSPTELIQCALGYQAPPTEARDTIKWHIHQLRRKIELDSSSPRYIQTVRYKGYCWVSDTLTTA
jgi:DNA-binding response OmpR family regulator